MSTTEAQDMTIALVTESLHRRHLDRDEAIAGDVQTDKEAAQEWLPNAETLLRLQHEAATADEDEVEALIAELVGFASTAVELWAAHSRHDPLHLVQQIAHRWEKEEPQT